jgi:hypothetical protein
VVSTVHATIIVEPVASAHCTGPELLFAEVGWNRIARIVGDGVKADDHLAVRGDPRNGDGPPGAGGGGPPCGVVSIDQTTRLSRIRLPPPVDSSSVRTATKMLLPLKALVVNDSARPPSTQLSWLLLCMKVNANGESSPKSPLREPDQVFSSFPVATE